MSDLDEYLESQLEEAHLESSGQFSVDYFKARDKMEQFRLPSSAHYLLKVIQAAVLSGAEEVQIRIDSSTTNIRFEPAKTENLQHFESITVGLGAPLEISDLAVRALAQALLGAMLNDWEAVCWRINHRKGSDRLWLGASGNRTERLVYRAGPIAQCVFTQFRPPNWRFWLSARDRAQEHHLLNQMAGFSPIPIRLDGRNLQRGLQLPDPHFFLYQKYWPHPQGFKIKLPTASSFQREGSRSILKSLTWGHVNAIHPAVQGTTCQFFDVEGEAESEQPTCQTVAAVDSELRPQAKVHYIHHGVSLTALEVDLDCPGLQLWLPLPAELSLDLTGFQIIRDENFQKHLPRLRAVAQEVRANLQQLAPQIVWVSNFADHVDDLRITQWRKKISEAFA